MLGDLVVGHRGDGVADHQTRLTITSRHHRSGASRERRARSTATTSAALSAATATATADVAGPATAATSRVETVGISLAAVATSPGRRTGDPRSAREFRLRDVRLASPTGSAVGSALPAATAGGPVIAITISRGIATLATDRRWLGGQQAVASTATAAPAGDYQPLAQARGTVEFGGTATAAAVRARPTTVSTAARAGGVPADGH